MQGLEAQSINVLFFLLVAVTLDLLIRWIAFGRIESVAIDIAIFSTLYSGVKLLIDDRTHSEIWGVKFCIGLVLLLVLTVLHRVLKEKLNEKLGEVFTALQKSVSSDAKDLVHAQHAILAHAVDVTLSMQKIGKRKRRTHIVDTLKSSNLDPKNILNDDSFILSASLRGWMLLIFTALAAASVLLPII